jgi:hypothetical protein
MRSFAEIPPRNKITASPARGAARRREREIPEENG